MAKVFESLDTHMGNLDCVPGSRFGPGPVPGICEHSETESMDGRLLCALQLEQLSFFKNDAWRELHCC